MSDREKELDINQMRATAHEIIFQAETPAGKWFDVLLIISIVLSVIVVMLDSVAAIREEYGLLLYSLEWFFTGLFTIEYIVRLACAPSHFRYARSFFGVVDLLAILPTYVSLALPGTRYLTVIRVLRILRIFRVLKLVQYISEARQLRHALWESRRKITVFLFTVLTLVVIFGSLMYLIEGPEHGFTSIPRSIYWAIVTLTTVGYGDISPKTEFGQFMASMVMILGYSLIIVPTGIVTAKMTLAKSFGNPLAKSFGNPLAKSFGNLETRTCFECGLSGHDKDAKHCKHCGGAL